MTEAEELTAIEIHPKFLPLFHTPHTIADIHGGRYGMKTEQVHKAALMMALDRPLRVVGVRETLQSIQDSSHKTISDIIYSYGMATSQNGPFEIQRDRIIRKEGDRVLSEFFYVGVRENIRDKKSLARIDIMIFDEAGKCSKETLNIFLPSVIGRGDSSTKAWFIWNPESVVDPIHIWFNGDPGPSDCIHIETSYLDNPWLSQQALTLVLDCKRDDYELYEHLYLGKPVSSVKGAIFVEEMKQAETEGRICKVPYNRLKPVHTSWDLGIDTTAIWFVQCYADQLHFIDFYQNKGQELAHYLIECQRRGYVYGIDNLPHDGVDALLHRKGMMGNNQDKSATIQTMMRDAGRKVAVGPKLLKSDRIRTVRAKFPQCRFDAEKCAEGIQALKAYQWDRDSEEKPGEPKPLHNFASHPADAFMEACVSVKDITRRPVPVVHSEMAEADV